MRSGPIRRSYTSVALHHVAKKRGATDLRRESHDGDRQPGVLRGHKKALAGKGRRVRTAVGVLVADLEAAGPARIELVVDLTTDAKGGDPVLAPDFRTARSRRRANR